MIPGGDDDCVVMIQNRGERIDPLMMHGVCLDMTRQSSNQTLEGNVWTTMRKDLKLTRDDWRRRVHPARPWLLEWTFESGQIDYLGFSAKATVRDVLGVLHSLGSHERTCFQGLREVDASTEELPIYGAVLASKIP